MKSLQQFTEHLLKESDSVSVGTVGSVAFQFVLFLPPLPPAPWLPRDPTASHLGMCENQQPGTTKEGTISLELPQSHPWKTIIFNLAESFLKSPILRICLYSTLFRASSVQTDVSLGYLSNTISGNCLTWQLLEVVIPVEANKKLTKNKRKF